MTSVNALSIPKKRVQFEDNVHVCDVEFVLEEDDFEALFYRQEDFNRFREDLQKARDVREKRQDKARAARAARIAKSRGMRQRRCRVHLLMAS